MGLVLAEEISLLAHKFDTLHSDVGEIKTALGKLSDAIVKLSLVEERQTQASMALDRAFASIERIERRLSRVELDTANANRTSKWVDRGTWACASAAIVYAAKASGLA